MNVEIVSLLKVDGKEFKEGDIIVITKNTSEVITGRLSYFSKKGIILVWQDGKNILSDSIYYDEITNIEEVSNEILL